MKNIGEIVGLIPAAGASKRMGKDKRRLPLGDLTVLETTLARLKTGGLNKRIVVLEENSPCLALNGLNDEEIEIVFNPDPDRGMLSSIRCGLNALSDDVDAIALQPGDHPFVPSFAVQMLLNEFKKQNPLLMQPQYADRRGHPLFIHRKLFQEAIECNDQIGLRQLVRQRQSDLVLVPIDSEGAEEDLDTPEDYKRLVL